MEFLLLHQLIDSIRTGHQFRSRIDPEPEGEFFVVQGKDIDERQQLIPSQMIRVDKRHIKDPDRNALLPDDLLFMARGTRLTACVIPDSIPQPSVSVSSFHVLRANPDFILPRYLAWAINDQPAQEWLKNNASGSTIPMITQKTLGSLILPVPPLETQKRFVAMLDLTEREHLLAEQLYEARQLALRGILQW